MAESRILQKPFKHTDLDYSNLGDNIFELTMF